MPPIFPARLHFDQDGTPRSEEYGDVFHTAAGALPQAAHVFLGGNGLPQRWRDKSQFVIAETGFGLGHNFLATWDAWRDDPRACERLHFISVEKHPLSAAELALAHQASGVAPELAQALRRHWPMPLPGFHRVAFDGGRVLLTLLLGDAADMLKQCDAHIDAIYLDGFAPSKNPDIWSSAVFEALARMSAADTTLATWSVAAEVRSKLAEAGFQTEKAQGFRGKREMLVGRFAGAAPKTITAALDKRALVIGAGLAGTAITERLSARGWQITLLDAESRPAQGASGNFAGAFRPQPSRDDNLMARITRAGFAYQLHDLARLAETGMPARWSQCGVLHLARDAVQEGKQRQAVQTQAPPPEFVQWLDAPAASQRAGRQCAFGGWWFPRGGWISPPALCEAHLQAANQYADAHLDMRFDAHVAAIEQRDGIWHALDKVGVSIASAPHVVLANAHDAQRLMRKSWLPLYSARGQVSHVPAGQLPSLETVICGSGYLTPAIDGLHALGATFMVNDPDTDLRQAEHVENLAKLELMLPGEAQGIDATRLDGRASLRPVTPDRLPFVGAMPLRDDRNTPLLSTVPRADGLWLLSGFGARGLVWGMLCAELLVSQMNGEPLPLERELVDALDPARYLPHR